MPKLTENVFTQHVVARNMVICKNDEDDSSMSVDARVVGVRIEIDNGEDQCVSFDMLMADAIPFFAALHEMIAPVSNPKGGL